MPVHIAVRSPTGEVEQLIHVVPRKATESKPFPVYHETWVSLGQAAAKAYFLVATDSTFQLVGFGEVTRGGRTYPAAYMVQLPRDATSS